MYPFPAWRRVVFVAVLVVVIVIAFAPAVTQGTATIRLSAITAPSVLSHIYVGISSIQLHKVGYLFSNNVSWTFITQSHPTIDLLAPGAQLLPQTVTSASVPSGRYDAIKVVFANSTVILAGQNKAVPAPQPIQSNMTLPISPNGIGDILLVVQFDYSTLFAIQPSLTFTLVRVSTV
jgi:uncharacterized protein DUF4382